MVAWRRNTWKFVEEFLRFFRKNDPLQQNFQNYVLKVFTASPIDVVVIKFREMLSTGNRRNRTLFTRQKNSPTSQTLTTARIAPKICQGQPPKMYSECSRFHPKSKSVHFRWSYRRTREYCPRKVNSIFERSLSSSRIIITTTNRTVTKVRLLKTHFVMVWTVNQLQYYHYNDMLNCN